MRLSWVSVLLLSAACTGGASVDPGVTPTPNWPRPFEDSGTLGASLEDRFTSMLAQCDIRVLDESDEVTRIPPRLHTLLSMGNPVRIEERDAAERLLRFVYPAEDIATYDRLNSRREFKSSNVRIGRLPPPRDLSNATLHYQNCSSVLEAAIDADLDIPLVSLEAGAKGGFRQQSGLGLVEGTFTSPLAYGLGAAAPFEVRFALSLDAWLWYRDNLGVAGAIPEAYFIDTFEGVAAIDYTEGSAARSYRLQGRVGFNAPFASVEGVADYSNVVETQTTSTRYTTYLFTDGDPSQAEVSFLPLPPPEELAAVVGQAEPRPTATSASFLQRGRDHSLQYRINGFPTALCRTAEWQIDGGDLTADVTLERVHEIRGSAAGDVFCAVDLALFPTDEIFDQSEDLFQGSLSLVSVSPVADVFLRISLPVRLPTTENPRLQAVGAATPWSVLGDRVRWSVPIETVDPESTVVATPQVLDDLHLTCGAGAELALEYSVESGSGAVFEAELSAPGPEGIANAPPGIWDIEECQVSGIAVLAVGEVGGATLRRPFRATVEYPAAPAAAGLPIPLLEALPTDGRTISPTGAATGDLTAADVQLPDDSYAQAWELVVAESGEVEVILESEDFDAFLIVLGPNNFQDGNDDASGLNSAVRLAVDGPTTFRVIVNTALPSQFGAYRLRVVEH